VEKHDDAHNKHDDIHNKKDEITVTTHHKKTTKKTTPHTTKNKSIKVGKHSGNGDMIVGAKNQAPASEQEASDSEKDQAEKSAPEEKSEAEQASEPEEKSDAEHDFVGKSYGKKKTIDAQKPHKTSLNFNSKGPHDKIMGHSATFASAGSHDVV